MKVPGSTEAVVERPGRSLLLDMEMVFGCDVHTAERAQRELPRAPALRRYFATARTWCQKLDVGYNQSSEKWVSVSQRAAKMVAKRGYITVAVFVVLGYWKREFEVVGFSGQKKS